MPKTDRVQIIFQAGAELTHEDSPLKSITLFWATSLAVIATLAATNSAQAHHRWHCDCYEGFWSPCEPHFESTCWTPCEPTCCPPAGCQPTCCQPTPSCCQSDPTCTTTSPRPRSTVSTPPPDHQIPPRLSELASAPPKLQIPDSLKKAFADRLKELNKSKST
jgi:hypothetical protein